MYFVGVDLAWGENKPTGIAVLDDAGRLLHVCAQSTDETIRDALTTYVAGECLVAFDAPLIVTNASGNRPCEAELNRDFRRFEAGAHPANTGKPEFSTTPRGARISRLLGLDMDPASTAPRRAIEVYPHPATIVWFDLERTLKYKNKPGRTLDRLRSELQRLMGLLEGLSAADPPLRLAANDAWTALVAQVDGATRKSELRVVEDQVDAVVCAYIGLFADRRPELTTTYGDLAGGYIVTPSLSARAEQPTTQEEPSVSDEPRAPRSIVRSAVQEYAALQPGLEPATEAYVVLVRTLLDDAGINYLSVTGRTKSVASFAAKADRSVDGEPLYARPLDQITDQIGVRVITYLQGDVTAVADLLTDQLTVLDDRDLGLETASEGRFGYSSRHILVTLDDGRRAQLELADLHGHNASVQIRTVLQHAWAEFEHDIRYKGSVPEEHAPDLDRRFTLAAGLLELADREFSAIRERLQAGLPEARLQADASDPRISAQDLAQFLAAEYADAGWSRTDHYAWVSGLLLELGITSLDELGDVLGVVDDEAINQLMGYRYPAGAVRRLDDALLAVFGERYIALHGNAHRQDLLHVRLEKLTEPGE